MKVLMLGQADARELLDLDRLLDALEEGFRALSSGRVDIAPRTAVNAEGEGFLQSMPGYAAGLGLGVKLVTGFPKNHMLGLPAHQAVIALFDPATGSPLAVMDGTRVTAIRTADAAALSARIWLEKTLECSRSSAPACRATPTSRSCHGSETSRRFVSPPAPMRPRN